MKWNIAYRTAFEGWRELDVDRCLAMLDWFASLTDGPPADVQFDSAIGLHWATAPTGNRVEMMILPNLVPPLIAIFRIR